MTQVLSILITAPLGAISIVFLGPRLLEKQEQSAHNAEEHLVEPKRISKEEAVGGEVGTSEMAPPPYHHATGELQQLQLTKETKELP